MEFQAKSGKVYLQPHKAGKKWKPVWMSLFPPSSSGAGRLEIQDLGAGGDGGTAARRHHLAHGDRKVLRLSELISVLRLPPNAEACPRENMSAFCVETRDRTLVLAAARDECVDWVDKLRRSSFQRGAASPSARPQMEENQIYASAEDVQASEFWVAVQRTEAAARCGLQGSYWLQVGPQALQLRDPQKQDAVREWPYELLRRYGQDGLTLTLEAGRRCDSGPGTFVFETQQAERIFSLLQSAIRRRTSRVETPPPLPRTPDVSGGGLLVENKAQTQGRKSPSSGDPPAAPPAPITLVAPPPPITLMPLPSVPPRSRPSDVIYSHPAEGVQPGAAAPPSVSSALYVDPSSVLPLKPPGARDAAAPTPLLACFNIDHPNSGYSEVYDKIVPVQSERAAPGRGGAEDEPIYAEPVHRSTSGTKSDPFSHLYAHVCKTARSPAAAPSSSASKDTNQPLDDTVYESLGVI